MCLHQRRSYRIMNFLNSIMLLLLFSGGVKNSINILSYLKFAICTKIVLIGQMSPVILILVRDFSNYSETSENDFFVQCYILVMVKIIVIIKIISNIRTNRMFEIIINLMIIIPISIIIIIKIIPNIKIIMMMEMIMKVIFNNNKDNIIILNIETYDEQDLNILD